MLCAPKHFLGPANTLQIDEPKPRGPTKPTGVPNKNNCLIYSPMESQPACRSRSRFPHNRKEDHHEIDLSTAIESETVKQRIRAGPDRCDATAASETDHRFTRSFINGWVDCGCGTVQWSSTRHRIFGHVALGSGAKKAALSAGEERK